VAKKIDYFFGAQRLGNSNTSTTTTTTNMSFIYNWVKNGHKMITEAKSYDDLGLWYRTHPDGTIDSRHSALNVLTLRQLIAMDEGLFCHMVNKVILLMESGAVPKGDVLGILDTDLVDVSKVPKQVGYSTSRYAYLVYMME